MDADFLTHWLNIILNPQIIYDSIHSYGTMLFTYVTPTLLVIAIAIRSAEESLDVANSNGRWVVAFSDMIGYGLLITIYFGVFSYFHSSNFSFSLSFSFLYVLYYNMYIEFT